MEFQRLGLAVIDEQHRFGVHQRLALSAKGAAPDTLVMTATPIPRTLVLSYFGDMDVSRLTEKPAGRQPIDTRAVPLPASTRWWRASAKRSKRATRPIGFARSSASSEKTDLEAAEERFAKLSKVFSAAASVWFTAR